jgi:hypothetical protein
MRRNLSKAATYDNARCINCVKPGMNCYSYSVRKLFTGLATAALMA